MDIAMEYSTFVERIEPQQSFTLSDAQTTLYLRASCNVIWKVKVDHGIIPDAANLNKCDFLIYNEVKDKTHLIELKGAKIDKALLQLKETVSNLSQSKDVSFFVQNQILVDAYIVSPGRQKIPKGMDAKHKELAKLLAKHSGEKVKDIYSLVKFVKVVSNTNEKEKTGNRITCTPKSPIVF